MEFNFSGKKFLVTGAGRGIGRAIAIALAKSGAKVYALNRSQASLDTLVQEYPNIVGITQNLKDWDETRNKLEALEPLDGLVNNACADGKMAPALDSVKDEMELQLQVNVLAYINCIQVVAKKMIAAGKSGSIVNLSSVCSTFAIPCSLYYNVTKASVDMVTKQFALELGANNIRVNSVNPTLVMTELVTRAIESYGQNFDQTFLDRMAIKRVPTVSEIAGPVLYLLSDTSSMVTGTSHFVDGGLSCNLTTNTSM